MGAIRPLARPACAIAAGVAVWASFPPLSAWPLAVLGVAGLSVAVRGSGYRVALGLGLLAGLGLWVPLMSFLRTSFGIEAWAAVAVIESLWFAALALALRLAQRARWWPAATPLLWVGQEFLRDRWPFGGLPWGRLAFGQADSPLLRLAAVGGAPLVTFAVALAGGLLAWVVVRGAARRVYAGLALAGLAVIAAAPLAISLPTGGTSRHGAPSSVVVAAVQGNVPRLGLKEFAQKRAVTDYHLAETRVLAAEVAAGRLPRPQLVIWPENSSDVDPTTDPIARAVIDAAARAVGVPILVGAVLDGPGPTHVRNAAIVWSPTTGPGQTYVKRHLVPFGEYLPWRSFVLKLSGQFSLISKDFVPGHAAGTLQAGAIRLADTICFEIADDTVVRQAVTGGGRLLVVQTNNADYERATDSGNGGETAQQLAIARLRAVESGRAVVVAATSGVSAMIAPDGTVLARTGVFRPALLDLRLPLRDPLTLADRVGAWPEWILSAAGLVAVLAALALPHRRRSLPGTGTEPSLEAPVAAGGPLAG